MSVESKQKYVYQDRATLPTQLLVEHRESYSMLLTGPRPSGHSNSRIR